MAKKSTNLSRNAPCPCGSGKKYKHCCLGRPIAHARGRRRIIGLVAALLVLVAAGIVGFLWSVQSGVVIAILGLSVIAAMLIFINAPRSRGRDGSDRIDFGRSG